MFGGNLGKILNLSEERQKEISLLKIDDTEMFLRTLTKIAQESAFSFKSLN